MFLIYFCGDLYRDMERRFIIVILISAFLHGLSFSDTSSVSANNTPSPESFRYIELSYNLQLPVSPGSLLFDKVEQVVIYRDNQFQKITNSFSYYNRISKINQAFSEYASELSQIRQKRSAISLICQLQI